MNKLPMNVEIGPGKAGKIGPEWTTVDICDGKDIDFVYKWGTDKFLAIEDNSADLVYSSHCLEHVYFNNTLAALQEVFRILKPGGCFEVWVPDFSYLVHCYMNRMHGDDWRIPGAVEDTPMAWLNSRLFTYQSDMHKAVFDFKSLSDQLSKVGFIAPTAMRREETRTHDHGPISLGIRSFKPME